MPSGVFKETTKKFCEEILKEFGNGSVLEFCKEICGKTSKGSFGGIDSMEGL